MDPCALYIHIPFCERRCHYCDFSTTAGQQARIPQYITALMNEIRYVSRASNRELHVNTIFAGGGTPSLVPQVEWERLFTVLAETFIIAPDAEISLEANPRTVDGKTLSGLREIGFNRLSLGMQSANPMELRLLGRLHEHSHVVDSVSFARKAGFDNINLDLIHGLPGQSLQSWQQTLEAALSLFPEHLSIYGLTIEPGTPFGDWVARGLLQAPDDDLSADQYEWACSRLEQAGFRQYEVSNWSANRQGRWMDCRHNLQYWRCQPYLGIGVAAHTFIDKTRVANTDDMDEYINRMAVAHAVPGDFPAGPASLPSDHLSEDDLMGEFMMVGLRLTREGISRLEFRDRFGVEMADRFGERIARLIKHGLLESPVENPDCLRLTPSGVLLGNIVFREFLGV